MRELSKENCIEEIEFINEQLRNNRTMKEIESTEYGENERVIHKRLVRIGYKKIDNQYVLGEGAEIKAVKEVKAEKTEPKDTNKKADLNLTKTEILALKELATLTEPLKGLLGQKDNTAIDIKVSRGLTKARQFRIDTDISEQFDEFCDKHKEYSIGQLLGQAILDFMNKHN